MSLKCEKKIYGAKVIRVWVGSFYNTRSPTTDYSDQLLVLVVLLTRLVMPKLLLQLH